MINELYYQKHLLFTSDVTDESPTITQEN